MKLAILVACYNRKNYTLSCLRDLFSQKDLENIDCKVFLTDDASTDGTAEAVRLHFPDVNLETSKGNLYWAGGMRNSWHMARSWNPDNILLLNDDTELFSDAISRLITCAENIARQVGKMPLTVGTTVDKHTGNVSYGGRKLRSRHRVNSYLVNSDIEPIYCDMANANILLIPNSVVSDIGFLSERFTHGIADYDFTLKASRAGWKVAVAPGIMGYCSNDHGNNWKSGHTSLAERIRFLRSPKGLAYDEYLEFIKEHFPLYVPVAFAKLWTKTLFPVLWDKFKKNNNH